MRFIVTFNNRFGLRIKEYVEVPLVAAPDRQTKRAEAFSIADIHAGNVLPYDPLHR